MPRSRFRAALGNSLQTTANLLEQLLGINRTQDKHLGARSNAGGGIAFGGGDKNARYGFQLGVLADECGHFIAAMVGQMNIGDDEVRAVLLRNGQRFVGISRGESGPFESGILWGQNLALQGVASATLLERDRPFDGLVDSLVPGLFRRQGESRHRIRVGRNRILVHDPAEGARPDSHRADADLQR